MAQAYIESTPTWEKPAGAVAAPRKGKSERLKVIIGGGLILAALVILIASGTLSGARFFMTVDELTQNAAYVGQNVRITGAVIGDSIQYDSRNLIIEFDVANVESNPVDLGAALHDAVNDPNATILHVRVENQVKPDLLRHEAQAILTGTLGADGVFLATELNLKCPSRFVEGMPPQLIEEGVVEGA
ncbi:MAG: cytochrome c maturation protein CcmE [Anaerolineae bacterium]